VEETEDGRCQNNHTVNCMVSRISDKNDGILSIENLHSIQDDERGLLLHQWVTPTSSQLDDPVNASRQNANERQHNREEKTFEITACPNVFEGWVQIPWLAADAPRKVGA
jgi:hypothetical protein